MVHNDELTSYRGLASKGEYVDGAAHVNSIEGYWSRLKNSIRGTHIHVFAKHLPKYLGEFEYRFNMRRQPEVMFSRLLLSF
jgi:ISXO2-like transposase domain